MICYKVNLIIVVIIFIFVNHLKQNVIPLEKFERGNFLHAPATEFQH